MNDWQEHTLTIPDGRLLWAERGRGSLLVFLHGDSGDEHRSLRSFADLFVDQYLCMLYDQRGSGGSRLDRYEEAVRPNFINVCGHLPCLEQPETLRSALRYFLKQVAS